MRSGLAGGIHCARITEMRTTKPGGALQEEEAESYQQDGGRVIETRSESICGAEDFHMKMDSQLNFIPPQLSIL